MCQLLRPTCVARIVVSDPLAEEGLDLLRGAGHTIERIEGEGAELAAAAQGAEAWIIRSGTRLDAAAIEAVPTLRAISRAGVGVDNVDLDAATRQGIAVFHAPTGNITSAAEQAWALLLAAARQVPRADASMKDGRWARKELKGVELAGKTMFIVGLGRIGRMMAARAQAFEMDVLGFDPYVTPEAAEAFGVESVTVEDGLARADVVTLHTPLTPKTRGMIDHDALARAKPGQIVVNAARGGLIDEAALLAALDEGRVLAAGIDVWSTEPPEGDAALLATHRNVVAAPHLGASTAEAQVKAATQACQRVADFLATGDTGLAVNAQARVPDAMRPWVDLAERLAGFGAQTLPGPLEEIVVCSTGLDAEALRVHALAGALRPGTDEPVNAINAPGMAEAKGWTIATRSLPADADFVRVELRSGDARVSVEGTYTPHYGVRVTRFAGFDLEFRPRGRFLVTRHDDVPGVLASMTAVLAQQSINIANVALARRDGQACAVIEIDGGITKAARDALRAVPHVHAAHRARLP